VDLLDHFVGLARQSLSAGDELVKSIGDAVMLASPAPGAAVAALAGLWERCWLCSARCTANSAARPRSLHRVNGLELA